MKSLFAAYFILASAFLASHTFTPADEVFNEATFFTCAINGKQFISRAGADSLLAIAFTYTDIAHRSPAGLFINAVMQVHQQKAYFYIQPLNDDAPSAALTAHNNLYNNFHITYKAADNTFYNSCEAPGNLEISSIDTIHKVITGRLNCMLYSSVQKDWLYVTNGRFCFKFG